MSLGFGLIGNGRVLARVQADGALTDAFFPSIGFYRHIIQSQFGLFERNTAQLARLFVEPGFLSLIDTTPTSPRPYQEAGMLISQRISLTLFCGVLCALLVTVPSSAQTVTGTISGTVTDSSGAIITAASVTLTNERTGELRKLATNEDARFTFSAVQPATYTVKIEAQGFQALVQKNVVLSANEDLALGRLVLKPGQVTETVMVTTEGAKVETDSSDLTARLTSDQISLISTKGRDVTSLLRLIPGTSYIDDIEAVGEGFGTDLPNISGQRGRSTVSMVDGLNASEPSGNNKLSMTTNQDAIAEVKVLRNNYAAEYGNNGGAMISLVTKSGGQAYHGSGYYFLRNEALNANDYFNNHAVPQLPRPLYRHNIWGINLGGPVQIPWLFPNRNKQKLFFFYSYEKPHTITPTNPVFVTVPTALERRGDFSQSLDTSKRPLLVGDPALLATGNICSYDKNNVPTTTGCFPGMKIPQSRWNSSGVALLNVFPLPNTLRSDGTNYQVQKSVDVPKWSQLIHIDFKPFEKDTFWWKAQQWVSDNEGLDTSGWRHNDDSRWGIMSHYLYTEDGTSFGWTRVFSPRVVNEATVGLRHDSEGFIPSTGMVEEFSRTNLNYTAPQLFPQNNKLGLIPQVSAWGGVRGTPARIFWLNRWGEKGRDYILPSVSDNLTLSRGSHIYKAGLYFEHLRNAEAPGGNWQGTLDFGTVSGDTGYGYANAMLGMFKQYTEDTKRPHANLAIKMLQWYVQDEWKVLPRLTVNYGLRLSYHTNLYERDKLSSNFDPSRYDPANATLLYRPFCSGTPLPIGTSCPSSRQFAIDPRNPSQLWNKNLVGTFIEGVGDPLNGIVVQSAPGIPMGFKDVKPIDWEPRLGISWAIFGNDKTVLHAMGGVYHSSRPGGGTTGGNLVSNAPFQRSLTLPSGTIDNLVNLKANPSGPTSLNALEIRTQTPTIYNFSLGIQQDIGFKSVMEISYVGSQMRHLGEKRNINGVPDTARFFDCTVVPANMCHPENRDPFKTYSALSDNFLKSYQGYNDINQIMYTGSANYNALQVQVNRRYTRGFQYGIAYTWSKTLDYAKDDDTGDVLYPRPYRLFNYAPADFDQRHIFTANYIYDVPSLSRLWNNGFVKAVFGGWQLSGTTSLVSGKPKTVSVSYNGTASATNLTDLTGGEVNARPFMLCDPNRDTGARDATGLPIWFDTSCFTRPGVGNIGNMRRNSVRLPGIFASDLAVFKNFHMTEKATLQFRWETYNLFNHTNFKDLDVDAKFNADGTQTNSRFGVPTSARAPRVMQGALRISF